MSGGTYRSQEEYRRGRGYARVWHPYKPGLIGLAPENARGIVLDSNRMYCFGCSSSAHNRFDCPTRPRCYLCGGVNNHYDDECTNPNLCVVDPDWESPEPESTPASPIQNHGQTVSDYHTYQDNFDDWAPHPQTPTLLYPEQQAPHTPPHQSLSQIQMAARLGYRENASTAAFYDQVQAPAYHSVQDQPNPGHLHSTSQFPQQPQVPSTTQYPQRQQSMPDNQERRILLTRMVSCCGALINEMAGSLARLSSIEPRILKTLARILDQQLLSGYDELRALVLEQEATLSSTQPIPEFPPTQHMLSRHEEPSTSYAPALNATGPPLNPSGQMEQNSTSQHDAEQQRRVLQDREGPVVTHYAPISGVSELGRRRNRRRL